MEKKTKKINLETHLQIISSLVTELRCQETGERENLMKIIFQNKFNLTCKTSFIGLPRRIHPSIRPTKPRTRFLSSLSSKFLSLSSVIYFISSVPSISALHHPLLGRNDRRLKETPFNEYNILVCSPAKAQKRR